MKSPRGVAVEDAELYANLCLESSHLHFDFADYFSSTIVSIRNIIRNIRDSRILLHQCPNRSPAHYSLNR